MEPPRVVAPQKTGALAIVAQYKKSGAEWPDVISVWTNFPIGGEPVATYFLAIDLGVKGMRKRKRA